MNQNSWTRVTLWVVTIAIVVFLLWVVTRQQGRWEPIAPTPQDKTIDKPTIIPCTDEKCA